MSFHGQTDRPKDRPTNQRTEGHEGSYGSFLPIIFRFDRRHETNLATHDSIFVEAGAGDETHGGDVAEDAGVGCNEVYGVILKYHMHFHFSLIE